jgi:hypothetical protein
MLVCLSLGLCALTALTVTNAALESQGRITAAVVSLLVGALVKLVASYILTGYASVGILGAPLGTVASYVVSLTVSVVALDIIGVKVRVTVKLALLLLVGIVCFYPPYKIIYSTGALSSSFASLIVALGVSCVAYVAVLLPSCVLVTGFDMFKMHKK